MDRKSYCTPLLLCLFFFPAVLFSPLYPSICMAKKVTLAWDANSEPDIEGYVVYRNVASPGPPYKYADTLPEDDLANPLKPRVTLTGLNEHTEYFVAVSAYDTEGNESGYSDEVCIEIVDALIKNCSASISPSTTKSSSGGGGSGGCFISSAGIKAPTSIIERLFISLPPKTLFAVLFLIFLVITSSILFKIVSHKRINIDL